jgi:glycerol uptake facilitator-like aquaporin
MIYPDTKLENPHGNLYFDTFECVIPLCHVYWGRLILQEVLQTFSFTMVYLVVKYDKSMRRIDRLIKAFCMMVVYLVCLQMTLGSGSTLNPALAAA